MAAPGLYMFDVTLVDMYIHAVCRYKQRRTTDAFYPFWDLIHKGKLAIVTYISFMNIAMS